MASAMRARRFHPPRGPISISPFSPTKAFTLFPRGERANRQAKFQNRSTIALRTNTSHATLFAPL